jgi:hypothetical protein
MNFFQINSIDSIDLYKIEVIRMYGGKVCAVLGGLEYQVDSLKIEEFLGKMSMLEKNIGLTQQYASV